MKLVLAIILTAAATLAGVLGVRAVTPGGWLSRQTEPTRVIVQRPARGDLAEIVEAPGQVEPRRKVSISARVSAMIQSLPFEEGDEVTRGDERTPASLLVRLDASDLEALLRSTEAKRAAEAARLRVAEAQIESQRASIYGTEASLAEARRTLDRRRQLLVSRTVSPADVEAAAARVEELEAQLSAAQYALEAERLSLQVMRHQLEAADADIARVREDLRYTTITSPIDGVITRINAEEGELVVTGTMNNPGTVLMVVADLSRMLFLAEVDEAGIGALAVGQPATITLQAYPDRMLTGVVETISLQHDLSGTGSRYYKAEIAVDTGGERIYTGLTGDARIETRRHEGVLTVPSQAVLGRRIDELPAEIRDSSPHVDADKTYAAVAYRLIDGKAAATPVRIGPSDATHTVILDGLDEDDRVVVGPYRELETLRHDQALVDDGAATAAPAAPPQPEARQ